MTYLNIKAPFQLESGQVLPELQIAYTTYGQLSKKGDNVIWVCHALTANSEVHDWWEGLFGAGNLLDPERYFIVCANMIGSCYGSTFAGSLNPLNGQVYGADFPLITIKDMVAAHELLRQHMGISHIHLAIGGSMGGQQVLEWAVEKPALFGHICLLATNAAHSPWGIAFNEAQRMALEVGLQTGDSAMMAKSLEAARAIAMLSYRSYRSYQNRQQEAVLEKIDDFKAASYQRYQGLKLQKRFDFQAYWSLSKSMDSHHVGRGRGGVEAALKRVKARTLVIGIASDILFPVEEQLTIANGIRYSRLEIIDSIYGHDGFLIEHQTISELVHSLLREPFFTSEKSKYKLQPQLQNGMGALEKGKLPGTERI
ncbi:MAG TPA: homoserine O-acetyltransferase [Saprospiraceae bacterium]|nr:homoserine O-acetyltransferase [Saprospiraceae bacterium]HMQ84807.1 homoserine O-acetyltransferase [Saprospiraceae bacterium]